MNVQLLYPEMENIVSTADPQTFDVSLQVFLTENVEVIRAYHENDARLEADRHSGGLKYIHEPNPAGPAYLRLREELSDLMRSRTVRCWHYTRLTEEEVEAIRDHGVFPGSLESMVDRVRRQVEAGRLSKAEQDAILAASPLRCSGHAQSRLGRFWVTDRALASTNDGVEPLLSHWGGEVVYFHLEDEALIARVQGIGRPVILELAVPVALTEHAFGFAESALSSVTEALGYPPQLRGIDAYLTQPLGPEGVIAIYAPPDFDRVLSSGAGVNDER